MPLHSRDVQLTASDPCVAHLDSSAGQHPVLGSPNRSTDVQVLLQNESMLSSLPLAEGALAPEAEMPDTAISPKHT